MKRVYNQTWQMFLRLMHYTNRRPDYQPYFTIKMIDDFLNDWSPADTIDWGCGENNHKLLYGNHIIGIDRTIEADIYGYPKDVWKQIPKAKAILAVNSMHFSLDVYGDVERAMDEKLQDGGEILLTLNNTGHASAQNWADPERWKAIGTLVDYWNINDHRELLEKEVETHVRGDHMILGMKDEETADKIILNTIQQTMVHDPWHGVVRVRLQK